MTEILHTAVPAIGTSIAESANPFWANARAFAATQGLVNPIIDVRSSLDHKGRPYPEIRMRDETSVIQMTPGFGSTYALYRPVTTSPLAAMPKANAIDLRYPPHAPSNTFGEHLYRQQVKDDDGVVRLVANACMHDNGIAYLCDVPATPLGDDTLEALETIELDGHDLLEELGLLTLHKGKPGRAEDNHVYGYASIRLNPMPGNSTLVEASANE